MPTYDYVCAACGHTFEKFQSMTAKVLRKCPACGERKLDRLIGAGAGVIFKGSGFYETDYKAKSGATAKDEGAKGEGGDSGGSKSDAKADAGSSVGKSAKKGADGGSGTGGKKSKGDD